MPGTQGPAAYKKLILPTTGYRVHECGQPKKKECDERNTESVWDLIDRNLDNIGGKMQKKLKLKEEEILNMYDKF